MTVEKRVECEHEFITVTNLYGKIIQDYMRKGVVYRSLSVCKICGKRGMSTKVDKTCDVKNKPELW